MMLLSAAGFKGWQWENVDEAGAINYRLLEAERLLKSSI